MTPSTGLENISRTPPISSSRFAHSRQRGGRLSSIDVVDALLNELRANPVCNLKTLSGNLFERNADPAQHRSAPSPTPPGPSPGGPQFF